MKKIFTIILILFSFGAKAQKIENIYFNLYTDSLKKGVHNYINVDGKYTNGSFMPLMSNEVVFTSSAGKWDGNSLILDKDFKTDSVVITVWLKDRPEVKKSVTMYTKKIEIEPTLKTEKELLEEWKKNSKKGKR
jgi:hypothetical protein